jgi:hypothetical protein
MECRFLLHNFKQNVGIVAEALLEIYGRINVIMDNKFFFAPLIENVNKDHKVTVQNKQLRNKITFVKNIGELITSRDQLYIPSEQRLIEWWCFTIDRSVEFDRMITSK